MNNTGMNNTPSIFDIQRFSKGKQVDVDTDRLKWTAVKMTDFFRNAGLYVSITNIDMGYTETRYELKLELGTKLSDIAALQDDLCLALACAYVRLELPVPGKSVIGICIPNLIRRNCHLGDVLRNPYLQQRQGMQVILGMDHECKPVIVDIAQMPNLLIGGTVGSGKTNFLHSLIVQLAMQNSPDDLKLILVDTNPSQKNEYARLPHLFVPLIHEQDKAIGILKWAYDEVLNRFQKFANAGARNITQYNSTVESMPSILIIIDDFADLDTSLDLQFDEHFTRLVGVSRSAGIHLICATQRPSSQVISGLVKANIYSRVAFKTTNSMESRIVMDHSGAEKLSGPGELLVTTMGMPRPTYAQAMYLTDSDLDYIAEALENIDTNPYLQEMQRQMHVIERKYTWKGILENDHDDLFAEAGRLIIEKNQAKIGLLQRNFRIGFNRAARIMDQLADAGVVGPEQGTKPREILMGSEEFEEYLESL